MTTLLPTGMVPYETLRQAEAITTAPLSPQVKKTALRRLYESALAQDAKAIMSHPTGHGIVQAIRGGAEGAGIGYLLGRLAGSKSGKWTDLAAAGVGIAGLVGSAIPGNPFATDCLNAGIASAAIVAYRRGEAAERVKISSAPAAHGQTVDEEDPTDPIVQIAKKIGLMGPSGT